MDDSKAGMSDINKHKLVCKDLKKLIDRGLLQVLEEPRDNENIFPMTTKSSSNGADDGDDETNKITFVFIFVCSLKFRMIV